MARRGCPLEFRRPVVDLLDRGWTVAEVVTDLGTGEKTTCT